MGLSINILTSGFLVTVIVFFALMGIMFLYSAEKMGDVLLAQDTSRNDLEQLDSAFNSMKTAYILAFIGAGLTLLLAILYAGHETVIAPSEYWHLALYLITYILLVVSVIYAFIGLNKLYNLGIEDRNGADAYVWAGLLLAVFAFIGLTATGSGRLGMNIVRKDTLKRVKDVETKINQHLPAIRSKVDQHLEPIRQRLESDLPAVRSQIEEHLPVVRSKVDEMHSKTVVPPQVKTQARSSTLCGCK